MTGDAPDDRLPPEDQQLLDLLGEALGDVDLPEPLLAAAERAFAWRDPDAALAELIEESAPAGVRGAPQHLVFAEEGGRRLEIELRRSGSEATAVGQLTPTGPASVTWAVPEGAADPVEIGAGGLFELQGIPRGPVRFTVGFPDGPSIVTDWVVV